jgi:plastocyanin
MMALVCRAWLALLMLCSPGSIAAPVVVEVLGADGEPMPYAILSLPGNAAGQAGAETALIDQREKRFDPFVTIVRPGSLVRFPNSDDTRHHVYSFSEAKTFELKLYEANDAPPVRFERPGLVTLGCNIHDNMKGYVLVTGDPLATVTDGNGVAIVDGDQLPAERPSLELWHPLADAPRTVTLTAAQRAGQEPVRVQLPFAWKDPQTARSSDTLERLLRGFGGGDAD